MPTEYLSGFRDGYEVKPQHWIRQVAVKQIAVYREYALLGCRHSEGVMDGLTEAVLDGLFVADWPAFDAMAKKGRA